MVIREAIGLAQPSPDDRLREDEMAIVPFIELQVSEGFRPAAIERVRIDRHTLEPRVKVIGIDAWSDEPEFAMQAAG